MPTPPSTRDRLLDAALRAFATNGVDGTPIIELEEVAGLAPGSGGFYRYFRTKDEVLEAAVRREIDKVMSQRVIDGPPAGAAEASAWLTAEFHRGLDMLATIGPLIAILARERSRIPELAREIAEQLVEGGARYEHGMIASARSGSDVPSTDSPAADTTAIGAVVISAIVGYHLANDYFGSPPAGIGRDEFVATLVALVLPA